MGRMIDVGTDIGRESRGPKLRDQVAKPLDINALLSARKEKLKGTKIADLEAEQERKRKQHLADMQEQDKNLDENGNLIKETEAEKEQSMAKEIAQLVEGEERGGRRRRNRRYIKQIPVSRNLRFEILQVRISQNTQKPHSTKLTYFEKTPRCIVFPLGFIKQK